MLDKVAAKRARTWVVSGEGRSPTNRVNRGDVTCVQEQAIPENRAPNLEAGLEDAPLVLVRHVILRCAVRTRGRVEAGLGRVQAKSADCTETGECACTA